MNTEVWFLGALTSKPPKSEETQKPCLCAAEEPGEGGRRKGKMWIPEGPACFYIIGLF